MSLTMSTRVAQRDTKPLRLANGPRTVTSGTLLEALPEHLEVGDTIILRSSATTVREVAAEPYWHLGYVVVPVRVPGSAYTVGSWHLGQDVPVLIVREVAP
jgi:hypothetical protein